MSARHLRPDDRREPWGMRRSVTRAAGAAGALFVWLGFWLYEGLSDAQPMIPAFMITAVTAIALAAVGRWLARAGVMLALLALVPVGVLLVCGIYGVGDVVLGARGRTVDAAIRHEDSYRLKGGGLGYTYQAALPDGSIITLDPGVPARLEVGTITSAVVDPGGVVAPRLAGPEHAALKLVLAGLAAVGLAAAVGGTARAGERHRAQGHHARGVERDENRPHG